MARELCAEKQISITARKMKELIVALMEAREAELESRMPEVGQHSHISELFELILIM